MLTRQKDCGMTVQAFLALVIGLVYEIGRAKKNWQTLV
jgi:hypothetical protein